MKMQLKTQGCWGPCLLVHILSALIVATEFSITHGAYVEQFLESVEVCTSAAVGPFSSLAKKTIRLQNYPNNTVVVKLTRWEEFWPSFLNFRCKFKVTAPKNYGVMVVIQAMHLRTKTPMGAGCRDFIKFEQRDGFKTGEICGELDDHDYSKRPDNLIGQRYFYDNRGQIDVSFSTDDKDEDGEGKPIFLKMIFTAYSECSDMAISTGRLKRCSPLRSHSCIASNLFCDGEINCAFNDVDFGSDEKNCDEASRYGKSHSTNERPASLYIFALTCVATLMLIIILVLLACCCIRTFRARTPPSTNSAQTSEHMDFYMSDTGPTTVSTIPGEINEKVADDLPPPYDALFPVSTKSNHEPSKSSRSSEQIQSTKK